MFIIEGSEPQLLQVQVQVISILEVFNEYFLKI